MKSALSSSVFTMNPRRRRRKDSLFVLVHRSTGELNVLEVLPRDIPAFMVYNAAAIENDIHHIHAIWNGEELDRLTTE